MDKRTLALLCDPETHDALELDADVLLNTKSGRRYPIRNRIPIFFASALEDSPAFLPDSDLLFRAIEGEANFLYRMHADGSDRRKIGSDRIFDFVTLSPDGRWAVVQAPDPNEAHAYAMLALPVEGGPPVRCAQICAYPNGMPVENSWELPSIDISGRERRGCSDDIGVRRLAISVHGAHSVRGVLTFSDA
jgi:uncharacterized protein YbaR (Trm112 family)